MIPSDLIPLPSMPYDERPIEMPLDVEECRTALWRVRGNVTQAAYILKVPSIRLRNFIEGSPRLTAEVKEAREMLLDTAEDVVYEALTDTDASRKDQMARFALTNLGGNRGYGQKGGNINLNLPKGNFKISWEDGSAIGPKTIEHEQ